MSRTLTLEMDAFGVRAFTELADREGDSPSRALRIAAQYYLADSEDGRTAWRVPSFADDGEPERRHAGVEVEVDDATWDALDREARRQTVAIGALAAHAVLYFLADSDSGRVAQRISDSVSKRRPQ
jgi:hypothetical protein